MGLPDSIRLTDVESSPDSLREQGMIRGIDDFGFFSRFLGPLFCFQIVAVETGIGTSNQKENLFREINKTGMFCILILYLYLMSP